MLINNQNVNIDDLFSNKYMHKEIKKGIFLSDYQIDVLNRYDIDPYTCSSINEILFLIDEILDEVDEDDLYIVYNELNEFNYYSNINK